MYRKLSCLFILLLSLLSHVSKAQTIIRHTPAYQSYLVPTPYRTVIGHPRTVISPVTTRQAVIPVTSAATVVPFAPTTTLPVISPATTVVSPTITSEEPTIPTGVTTVISHPTETFQTLNTATSTETNTMATANESACNSKCPPASDYSIPSGYRLAGISPSCQAVPVSMTEPYP